MKFETYLLPDHWASALVNGDETGLEDDDLKAMNRWLSDTRPGYCVDCQGEPEFTPWHDAQGYALACNCVKFTFQEVTE